MSDDQNPEAAYIDHKADASKRELPPYQTFEVVLVRNYATGQEFAVTVVAHGRSITPSGVLEFHEMYFNPYKDVIDVRPIKGFHSWVSYTNTTGNVSTPAGMEH